MEDANWKFIYSGLKKYLPRQWFFCVYLCNICEMFLAKITWVAIKLNFQIVVLFIAAKKSIQTNLIKKIFVTLITGIQVWTLTRPLQDHKVLIKWYASDR